MTSKRFSVKKISLCIIGSLLLLFFIYWLKVQLGVNLLSSYSLGSWFPFHYLADRTIYAPETGTVFYEDFEGLGIVKKWLDVSLANGVVSREKTTIGTDSTTCLVVRNTGSQKWVYSYVRMIETHPGDVFYYEGLVDIRGNNAEAYLNLGAFDESDNV